MKKKLSFIILGILCVFKLFSQNYTPDILGQGFEQRIFNMPNDYEGKVVSTLVRFKSDSATNKAALYIHGFNDYFFQKEMAEEFANNGYNFYAIDLRKCGRSLLPNQRPCNTRKIKEYYRDIDSAITEITKEKNDFIVLCGHSTGGLIACAYANEGKFRNKINALWLNSPFFDMNISGFMRRLGIPVVSGIGGISPNIGIPIGKVTCYGESLHKDYKGEWNYNLNWKPLKSPNVTTGWVRAITRTQKRLRKGFKIKCPILVMCSDKTMYGHKWNDDFKSADIVLNVDDICRNAKKLGKNVTLEQIENGVHDLVLSKKNVREKVYQKLFEWLNSNVHTKNSSN